jgi:uncharacterized protein DUF4260
VVTGLPKAILRLEGAAVFIASVFLYREAAQGPWPLYLVLWLVPDLAVAAYVFGPRIGAAAYNAAHFYGFPIALAAAGIFGDRAILYQLALIWFSHIGLDRALGLGLKYPSAFGDTHLGTMGRQAPAA